MRLEEGLGVRQGRAGNEVGGRAGSEVGGRPGSEAGKVWE